MNHACTHEADIATLLSESRATRSDVADIKKCLITGNGVPAMTVRMARVEQITGAAVWFAGVVIVALLGLVVAIWKGA